MVAVERHPEAQPDAASPPALAIDGVSHSYGPRQALADVSLSIPPATFVVLLGLNGAGKSTLFSLITRLFATQRGQIRIFGHDVARAPGAALRLLGVVFQLRTLDLDLSVMQNLTYHAALHGIGRRSALDAPAICSRESNFPIGPRTRFASCRAVKCVGWRSLARFCTDLACCCSMSQPSASTSGRAPISCPMCAALLPKKASACCGQPILSTRYRKPTPSPCCTTGAFSPTVRYKRWSRVHARRTSVRLSRG